MDVRRMKHAAKLVEWSEKVQAYRSSRLTVKKWCEQNNVCSKTYYTWEREYLAEVSKQLVIPEQMPAARASQIVRVDPKQMPDEMEVILKRNTVPHVTLRPGSGFPARQGCAGPLAPGAPTVPTGISFQEPKRPRWFP